MRLRDILIAFSLLLLLAGRVGAAEAPEPLPTPADTSELHAETLTTRCTVPHPDGSRRESAREAAFLTALGRLALLADHKGLDSPIRVDAAHPRYDLLGWLLESQLTEPQSPKGLLEVRLESPPLHSLGSPPSALGTTLRVDLDGDGEPEEVSAGPDTRIRIHRGQRLVAISEPLGFLEVRSLPGPRGLLEMVRLTRTLSVEAGEPCGPGRAHLKVRLLHSEVLGGRCAGRFEELREVPLALTPPEAVPTIELAAAQAEEAGQARFPLRGRVHAPNGLAEVQVDLNEAQLWRSPPGLKGQELELDLVLDLRAGLNQARLAVTDRAGLRTERPLVLSGPPHRDSGQGLAVVIDTQEACPNARAVAEVLTEAGFSVSSYLGSKATREAILKGLATAASQARPGDQMMLYFAGSSRFEGSPSEKVLATAGGDHLTGAELGDWARRLPGTRLLVVLDTVAQSSAPNDERWAEGSAFLAKMAGPDRILLATGDPSESPRFLKEVLTQAFIEAWQSAPNPFAAARRTYPLAVQEATHQAEELAWPLLRED